MKLICLVAWTRNMTLRFLVVDISKETSMDVSMDVCTNVPMDIFMDIYIPYTYIQAWTNSRIIRMIILVQGGSSYCCRMIELFGVG